MYVQDRNDRQRISDGSADHSAAILWSHKLCLHISREIIGFFDRFQECRLKFKSFFLTKEGFVWQLSKIFQISIKSSMNFVQCLTEVWWGKKLFLNSVRICSWGPVAICFSRFSSLTLYLSWQNTMWQFVIVTGLLTESWQTEEHYRDNLIGGTRSQNGHLEKTAWDCYKILDKSLTLQAAEPFFNVRMLCVLEGATFKHLFFSNKFNLTLPQPSVALSDVFSGSIRNSRSHNSSAAFRCTAGSVRTSGSWQDVWHLI